MAHEASKQQTLRDWSVVGHNRLVGSVYNRPGQADGKTVMTSPVLEVRLMGEHNVPVAFTESGSAYWLADPSAKFGIDAAETFVWNMSHVSTPEASTEPDPSMRTMILDRRLQLA